MMSTVAHARAGDLRFRSALRPLRPEVATVIEVAIALQGIAAAAINACSLRSRSAPADRASGCSSQSLRPA